MLQKAAAAAAAAAVKWLVVYTMVGVLHAFCWCYKLHWLVMDTVVDATYNNWSSIQWCYRNQLVLCTMVGVSG